jgi:hypothetical protein
MSHKMPDRAEQRNMFCSLEARSFKLTHYQSSAYDSTMQPGERITLIKKIASGLQDRDWSELDLILRQFKLPTSDSWEGNDKYAYVVWMIDGARDETLVELHDYVFPDHIGTQESESATSAGAWTTGRFRLFLSHTSPNARFMTALKEALAPYYIDGFVAHEDIDPGAEWQGEIETALQTCDALVAYLTDDFSGSKWCDQEVGAVMGRSRLIIPVRAGITPYGFMGKYQAIRQGIGADDLALELFELLRRHELTRARMAHAIVERFAASDSFNAARTNLPLLRGIESDNWSPELCDRVESACDSNRQIAEANVGFGSSTVAAEARRLVREVRN